MSEFQWVCWMFSARGSNNSWSEQTQLCVGWCEDSLVSERRPGSLRPHSLSGSQEPAGQLELRHHTGPAYQVGLTYWPKHVSIVIHFRQVLINVCVQLLLRWGRTWSALRDLSQALPAVSHGRPPLIGQPPDEAGRGEKLLPLLSLQQLFVDLIGLNVSVCLSVCVSLQESDDGCSWQAFQSTRSAGRAGSVTFHCLFIPS